MKTLSLWTVLTGNKISIIAAFTLVQTNSIVLRQIPNCSQTLVWFIELFWCVQTKFLFEETEVEALIHECIKQAQTFSRALKNPINRKQRAGVYIDVNFTYLNVKIEECST